MSEHERGKYQTLAQTSICKRCGGTIQYAKLAPHMPIALHGRYMVGGQVVEMCEDKRGEDKRKVHFTSGRG